jgi:very-short-patch-repair endonuclease
MRKIIPYNPKLKELAQKLRKNSTKSEIVLWNQLKGKQLRGFSFHRQKPLLNFIADFYSYGLKLVIELDGYTHQFDETFKKDQIKQNELEKVGLTVLRISDEDVLQNLEGVIFEINRYIDGLIQFEKE